MESLSSIESKNAKLITVFTPTYNRAGLLHRVYESLVRQTNQQFKWLVIDDGSTDETQAVVESFVQENKIEITYIYKENGGLHSGYNAAIARLDTELSICIDSDDWLPDDAIERILKVAFEFAMKRNKHLTVVDKANVLASSRLWRQIAKEMEPQYPEVTTDYMFIDNASMRVLTEPRFFDVVVTENTFGDILTDETSCITGSMGLQPSSSLGEHTPLFEPVHGSWPQAAGKNIANPLAQILSGAMLLEHFGLAEEGALIRKAVDASLDANVRTPEIQVEGGATYGTKEVGAWIVDYIKKA